ncbi:hypothetical protein ACN38_g4324 [Penicillium nordicum]|uniref:Uncharacterized protein n=1 Tax=Penicillium nordicum TaxID=229535 RepID=A0A0M8PBJ7_9EURO|nr:hypothetical protein ACN38_g4324 [Penicillium nordicum]
MAVNEGLAIGLSLGIGIPVTVLLIILAVTYGRRRHPKLPQPDACENTETWLNLYHATRPRSFVEKICSIVESLRVLRKPIVQEVYMMEDGAKVPK